MLLWRLHHSWNLRPLLEKPLWLSHSVLQTLTQSNISGHYEKEEFIREESISLKRCPMEQNSRYCTSHYFVLDKPFDLSRLFLCMTIPHLKLLWWLQHSWNLRPLLEKPLWLGHFVLRTLTQSNISREYWNEEFMSEKSSWLQRYPLEQNSRCRQSHYFVPIDLFGGQEVVQINLKKWKMCWLIHHLYEAWSLRYILCLFLNVLYLLQSLFKIEVSWSGIVFLS